MRFLGVCCAAALGPAGLRPQDTEGRHAPGAQSGVGIKSSSSSFQTWSTPPSALIRRTFPRASKYWTTGRHSRLYDARRFSTIAGESIGFLRSFSRCANRCLQESSEHSRCNTKRHSQTSASNARACAISIGNPSMRNVVASAWASSAFLIKGMAMSPGTTSPSRMTDSTMRPCSDPVTTSLRRTSLATMCLKPNLSTSFAHCVPRPEPGGPRTKIRLGRVGVTSSFICCKRWIMYSTGALGLCRISSAVRCSNRLCTLRPPK
mmetsp:Transcript_11195/g.20671  ORF Transcript_11195/g.20671 Transcript_11195/m.20671 type:complete len:263 (+) Transcript_11195:647-1435(+)